MDVRVPPIMEEIARVVKTVLQEQISERIRKQIVEQATEVPKTSSRDRTLQRAVEQILDVPVPEMVTQLLEVPKIIPQDRILQRTVKQAETSGADGQTHSLFQKSSSAALQTSTDLKEFEMVISVRRLAEQEHSTALDQLVSRISVIMKFGGDPFVKVKDLFTDLISRVQAEASSETNQKSYCDEEMSKVTEKREYLEADLAKDSSKLEAAVARSIGLDGEILAQRQIPFDRTVQKTVETPQLQCVDQVVDDPVVQVPRVQVLEKTAEIPQLQTVEKIGEIPQTQTIQGTQAPESLAITPVCQVRQTGHVEELIEVSKVFSPDTVQQRFGKQMVEIPAETQMIQSARTSESSVTAPVCQMTQAEIGEVIEIGASIPAESAESILVTAPVLENSPVVVGSEQPAHVAEYMALAPMVSEIRDLKSDLVHIRELLGVLVRKERSAEAKVEMAARRLNRMERERDQDSEAESETTLEEALADHSKVVRVIVDKWFVDKGFGFGKTPSGQIVFIDANTVQGAEVLKIGTDARVEVVNDDARAQGEVSSQTCLVTRRVESGEGQGESKQGGPASKASSGTDC